MQAKKKRLTLDMDPAFQRRLKATAALKGISMRQYCLKAIGNELVKDESEVPTEPDIPDSVRFKQIRDEIFGGRKLPGNSADLIREAREIRDSEIEGWA